MQNNEFLLLFILGHLTGDYVLQTNKIAKWKAEGIRGVAVHTMLICLSQLAFLSCFGIKGIAAALLGAGVHFLIDYLKLILGKYLIKVELFYFFIDQLLHFITIVLLTLIFAPEKSMLDSYVPYVKLLIGVILIIYTATVTAKNVARHYCPELKKQSFFKKNERWIDAFTGVLLYVTYLIHPLLSLVMLVCGAYIYYRMQAAAYQYSRKISYAKYITLAIFVLLALLLNGNV